MSDETREHILMLSILLAIVPVFLPVMLKFYDVVVVNLIQYCSKKRVNKQTALSNLVVFLLAIPAAISRIFGTNTHASAFSKLTVGARAVVLAAKRGGKPQTITTTRVVRRWVGDKAVDASDVADVGDDNEQNEDNEDIDDVGEEAANATADTTLSPGIGTAAKNGTTSKKKEEREEDEEQDDDDGGA